MTGALRVWAPRARDVQLLLVDEQQRIAMPVVEPGVYELPRSAVRGAYQILIDGDALPDPRASSMDDVLGPCRVFDAEAYTWSDAGFRQRALSEAVLYELHIGTFSAAGTFDGAIAQLPHLAELGVTHIELMPVATFSGARGWGYDGAGLFAPLHAYGGPAGLQRLVDAAHAHGLAVILDVVYNHLGPIGNFLERFGPYFHDHHHTPWGKGYNFDGPDSHEVRRFFIDNALHWLRDFHIDGLRLDAVQEINDTSAMHFLEQLSRAVRELATTLAKPLVLIGESDLNDPRMIREVERHGHGLDAQWSDDFHHALHVALTDESNGYYADFAHQPLQLLARSLTRGFIYDGKWSAHRRRMIGRPLADVPLARLIGYTQNHDQVGNRAEGDRHAATLTPARLKLAATLLFTSPFVPMLFQGEEWAASTPFQFFSDHRDHAVGEATRNGRRREFAAFGWDPEKIPDPQAETTFQRSKLCFHERTVAQHAQQLSWVKQLIALRRDEPDLRGGNISAQADEHTLVIERGPFVVVAHFATAPRRVTLPAACDVVLTSHEGILLDGTTIEVPAEASAILKRRAW
jgi:maltooligosyltrehalose trehalohydrolase